MNPQEEKLRAQAGQVRERLQGLTDDLHAVDGELESLAPQREKHELLDQACGSLERLDALGAASLFWGDRIAPAEVAERLGEARGRVDEFQGRLDEVNDRREVIQTAIRREEEALELLGEDLYDLRQAEERRKLEWVVERDISPVAPREQRMAWARGGEDDRRFYTTLAASLLVSALLGALLPMIDLPLPELFQPEQMPRRLAQLVREEQARLVPPPPPVDESPTEEEPPKPDEPKPVEEPPEPPPERPPDVPAVASAEPAEQPGADVPAATVAEAPRQAVEKAGILAFRDEFASLAQDKVAERLGADARLGDADDSSRAASPSRAMLTSNAPGGSGGINIASLSRNVGGGGRGGDGGGIHGVPVGRATSTIASIGGGGRPTAGRGGPGASRTDEEIQIVFDRYKASFYRLYNRRLREDPTLQGQIVLRLTIEPDGGVSMCTLQSTDMDAPDLAAQVVARVQTINFGAKEGVQALTIVYPIDFLPAT